MASAVTIDLRHVARGTGIPLRQVQAVVELLDEGNTVPFITRYRKDRTGGLDEEQIRQVQGRLAKLRMLADRKQTILRSIEAQGKLTEELARQILGAGTTKRLEDLYLPFRPKKQTLATLARSRGLEALAHEILAADPACADLDARARDFVNPDRRVPTAADALLGAGHILAEELSERAELRQRLREILQRTGKVVATQAAPEEQPAAAEAENAKSAVPPSEIASEPPEAAPNETVAPAEAPAETEPLAEPASDLAEPAAPTPGEVQMALPFEPDAGAALPPETVRTPHAPREGICVTQDHDVVEATATSPPATLAETPPTEPTAAQPPPESAPAGAPPNEPAPVEAAAPAEPTAPPPAPSVRKEVKSQERLTKKELKKKRAEEKRLKAFRDYYSYREEIRKIPPHRILAINRGERAKMLRVKIESDTRAMQAALDELLVPVDHPHPDYLRGCARDALSRLILPSLEREVRRELTERAEAHAVSVFAKNLRNLLLQPPVRDRRVLAVDPGFKSGCKLAALDQFGNLIEHAVIFLIGKPERREQARQKVIDLMTRLELSVIVIGNGTACRECEDFFAELIGGDLKERGAAYVIVNEAGASVYSTSRLGREEFPHCDATLRGAISIGRRLQDPLSELVKIEPANIGVGLYQHDVKAKHLQTSLDEVVESCVNYVGVDVNTASPALLRYVSGLNQLTARRLYEYRREHGPFRSREQFREVPGFGEATFVQAAGFLKIADGGNSLDATWIHPESYEAANQILGKLQAAPGDLADKAAAASLSQRVAAVDREAMAKELGVGTLTLSDILAQLARPGRDPREDLPPPVFKQGVLKLEDLTPGMELTGTVLNVVDFGAFVDIGMHDSGLVHVSHLADRFIRDPHEVVAVGDIVKVWVLEVDKERRRVSLTMVKPGTQRQRPQRHGDNPEGKPGGKPGGRPPYGKPREKAEGQTTGGPPGGPSSMVPRPPRPPRPRPPRAGQPQQGGGPRPEGQRGTGGPPQRKGPPQGQGPPQRPRPQQPRPRPKPITPITDAMKEGKEPLRTFGDLLQFYAHTHKPSLPPKPPKPPAEPPAAEQQPPAEQQAFAAPPEQPPCEPSPPEPSPPAPAESSVTQPNSEGDVQQIPAVEVQPAPAAADAQPVAEPPAPPDAEPPAVAPDSEKPQ